MKNQVKSTGASEKRGKREIKADETRRALFDAAAKEVGKLGYEGASVTAITKRAGVANGTFYNYFETRQQLFDQLLPVIGDQLLDYIRERLMEHQAGVEREHQRILAYFEFFDKNPGFLRIVNEAEVFAPQAFKQHIKSFVKRYSGALKRQHEAGELGDFREDEIETLVYLLMGARSYLTMLWRASPSSTRAKSGQAMLDTYVKLVSGGLFAKNAVTPAILAGGARPAARKGGKGGKAGKADNGPRQITD